jgi:hypothetical protein
MHRPADGSRQVVAQDLPAHFGFKFQSHILACRWKKWHAIFESKGRSKKCVVADLWMDIQRQMGAVNRHVSLHEQAHLPVGRAGDPLRSAPEKTMVHDQKIHPSLRRLLDHGLGGIHRSADSCQTARALDLEAIHGLWKVPYFSCAQEVIKVSNGFGQVHGKTITPEQAPIEVFSLKGFISAHKLDC